LASLPGRDETRLEDKTVPYGRLYTLSKPVDDKLDVIRLASQKHAIFNEQLALNQTKSKNKEYKREIEMLRREIMYKNSETKRLQNLTKKMHKKASRENKEATANKS